MGRFSPIGGGRSKRRPGRASGGLCAACAMTRILASKKEPYSDANNGANVSPSVGDSAATASLTRRLDIGLALATSIVGLLALVSGFTTAPRSGPFCRAGCLGYPYTDAAAFVPRDYWWLYPQSLLVLLVLVLLVRIHAVVGPPARVFSGSSG